MRYTDEQLEEIFDRTDGRCHLCKKKLAFKNYGRPGERAAWEVEHSNARANGGTDHGRNLKAACIPCNRAKGAGSTKAMREMNGLDRAPLSREKREEARDTNTVIGAGAGAVLGGVTFGPVGAVVGALLGGAVGRDAETD
jgi:hypothetical protein